jgi:DNA-directed RNA polymerase sigma subunit (sigma70/sigma32)
MSAKGAEEPGMERTCVSKSSALKDYLTLVASLPVPGEGDLERLEQALAAGDAGAGLALTEGFLGLVIAEASSRRGQGLRFEALIAAGNRGLAEALRQQGGRLRQRVLREVRRSLRGALARSAARRAQEA